MKMRQLHFILVMLSVWLGVLCSYAEEPEYSMELTSTDLQITSTDTALHFVGTANSNRIELYVKGIEQGQYGDYTVLGNFQETLICVGTGTYSYSEEYLSDCLVAYMDVDELFVMKFTMYTLAADDSEPAEEIVLENVTYEICGPKGNPNTYLMLMGNHDTYGSITICLDGCDGTYGTYQIAMYAKLGKTSVTGNGTWSQIGNMEQLDATLVDKTGKTYHVIAYTGAAPTTHLQGVDVHNRGSKIIENGQLIIIKNGIKYNILGNVMNNN